MIQRPALQDVSASLVVFLIALPLSMGIAIASGVPPAMGLVTAIVGGLVVGTIGGAPLLISGPSAGLSVLIMQMVSEHGIAALAVIVIVAGLTQLGAGLMRIGRQFQAVSPAVIRGMLSGIGVLILASQFHIMIDDKIQGSGLQNVLAIPAGIIKAIADAEDRNHDIAALIGIGTLAVVLLWQRLRPERLKIVPGALVGAVLAAAVAALLDLPIRYVAVPANLHDLINLPSTEALAHIVDPDIIGAGVALAFVASAESLLCATAVSNMHDCGRTNYDRELAGQGIANVICGVFGCLPMAGVISRSTANVDAGARTRWSAIMHALWIGLFVVFLPDLLALVPTSSLAAILIYVGYKLLNPAAIRRLSRFGRPVIAVVLATAVSIVAIDLLKGIIIGLVLSSGRLLYKMSHVEFHLEETDGRAELHLAGSATFLALPRLAEVLERIPDSSDLEVHFDNLEFIDHGCLDLLHTFGTAMKRPAVR